MADERFTGKVLFATGGGSGIAAATARRFAAEGGRIAVVDLDGDRARGVAEELDGSCAIACDVADERSVQQAVDEAVQRLGRIDCVLNAAGHVHFAPLEQVSLEEWNRMLAVHLTGTFLVCRATLPALRTAGGGSIVNLSSVTALVARTNLAAYSSVKGAILSLSRQLALDLAVDNVRVNAIAPGSVRTPMTQPVYGDEERAARPFRTSRLDPEAGRRAGGDRRHGVLPVLRGRELPHRHAARRRWRLHRHLDDPELRRRARPGISAPHAVGIRMDLKSIQAGSRSRSSTVPTSGVRRRDVAGCDRRATKSAGRGAASRPKKGEMST